MRAAELSPFRRGAAGAGVLCEHGPPELAADARSALAGGFDKRVRAYWETGEYDYLARAALAPYARLLRETGRAPERGVSGNCVFCGGGAWCPRGRFRPDPAPARARCASSTARSVHSPGKWAGSAAPRAARRIREAAVLHGAPAHGRSVEACQSCKTYVKSVDLTVDARRVPEIDELVALSLDLWAVEAGVRAAGAGAGGAVGRAASGGLLIQHVPV